MSTSTADQSLLPPGFRFHPTDEELIVHYLKNRAASVPCPVSIIAEVDIYKFDPWDLPARACFGDKEWYFFTPRDRKYPNGVRPNRAAGSGYWKATGTDKPIVTVWSGKSESIGVKKALVFYRGKPPKGMKTNWIMHEYRLADTSNANASIHLRYSPPFKQKETSMRLDDWVLCRIYEKSSNHGTPPASADHLSMENTSFLTSFSDMAGQQSRLQLHNELFSDTDFTMLSRFLNDNSQDMAAQEQLLQQFALGPDMNQALFNNAHCSLVPDFMRVALHHGLGPTIGGSTGGTKRMRMMDGLGGEDDGYGVKNFGAGYSSSSTSGYVSPIDATQTSRIDQSYLLNTQFGFQ